MLRWLVLICVQIVAASLALPTNALCSGASVAQEHKDADLIVRVRVVSEMTAWNDKPSAEYIKQWGDEGPVVLYGLQVVEVFKGAAPRNIQFFEVRNSGAFYLDADMDYLLFLNRIVPYKGRPSAAKGAFFVRYACGQSKPWLQVQAKDLAELKALSLHK